MTEIIVPAYAQGSCGVTHVDAGLLEYFRDQHDCRSMLDVGCGPGGQVQVARELGYRALGVDVDFTLYRKPGVALIDCCVQPITLPVPADLVWSVECAEHIPPECVDAYIRTLTDNAGRFIVMTASQQVMPLHVSVHPVEWWVERITASGQFFHDPEFSRVVAAHSTMQREFLRETGLFFWRISWL